MVALCRMTKAAKTKIFKISLKFLKKLQSRNCRVGICVDQRCPTEIVEKAKLLNILYKEPRIKVFRKTLSLGFLSNKS